MAEVIRQWWTSTNRPGRGNIGASETSSILPDGRLFWHRLTVRFTDEESQLLTAWGSWDEKISVTVGVYGGNPLTEHVTPRALFGGIEFATKHPSLAWENEIVEGLEATLKWARAAAQWDGEQTTSL